MLLFAQTWWRRTKLTNNAMEGPPQNLNQIKLSEEKSLDLKQFCAHIIA